MSLEHHAEIAGSPDPAALGATEVAPDARGGIPADGGDPAAPLSMPALPARLGTTIGGYRLGELLGVGGTAAVYKASRCDGAVAAIKVLHAWLNADPRAKKRFL